MYQKQLERELENYTRRELEYLLICQFDQSQIDLEPLTMAELKLLYQVNYIVEAGYQVPEIGDYVDVPKYNQKTGKYDFQDIFPAVVTAVHGSKLTLAHLYDITETFVIDADLVDLACKENDRVEFGFSKFV